MITLSDAMAQTAGALAIPGGICLITAFIIFDFPENEGKIMKLLLFIGIPLVVTAFVLWIVSIWIRVG